MQFGIVAIGYNRKNTLERLLSRLNECVYDDEVVLLISIDNSGSDSVEKIARDFFWKHGRKQIITYPERLGLRKHILTCGSYMEKYHLDAVAVFEDDIYPSTEFYVFMKQAVKFYSCDDRIAGISLYAHSWNVHVDLPFQPQLSGYDAYFMQFAQSWGQIWIKKQWSDFVHWYEEHSEEFFDLPYVPRNVCNWPETSWLKYHIRYCIEKNKYFVYPYISLATCFAEVGEHVKNETTKYQVPLRTSPLKNYIFPNLFEESAIHYDSFFENVDLKKFFYNDICIDLYGYKEKWEKTKYYLTTKRLDFKIEKSYGMFLKPQELNCIYQIDGDDIFLYDITQPIVNKKFKINKEQRWEYYYGDLSPINISVKSGLKKFIRKIVNKLRKCAKR